MKTIRIRLGIVMCALIGWLVLPSGLTAKSLYVNRDLNAGSPIRAYDIQPAPAYLALQMDSSATRYGGAGLAIDTDSATLFVTFEGSGVLDIVDAVTLNILGQVTAPSASNLAGIVVDQDNSRVYTVQRVSPRLYVYDWNATAKTLTLHASLNLPGVSQIYGIALDEVNDWLFVGDNASTTIRYFNTSDWTQAGSFPVSQKPMGIAVDAKNKIVYTGNAYPGYGGLGLLSQYDLNTGVETTLNIRGLPGGNATDNVVGLAVDPQSSLLYITTGNQGSGGSDRVMVFDSSLNLLYATGDIGNPTGLCVPGKQISYNPLNLSKADDVAEGDCAPATGMITYTLAFDNLKNAFPVNNVMLVDTLPPEVDFVSADGAPLYDPVAHTVSWTIGVLPAGDPGQSLDMVVEGNGTALPGASIANYATITGTETGPTTVVEYTEICVNQPPVAACQDVVVSADENCQAEASIDAGSYDPDGDPVVITESPAGPYPLGDTLVTLVITDDQGASDQCSATVTVVDDSPAYVECVPTTNPSGKHIPKAGWNPKSGQNPDGFYQLLATDNCDPDPMIFIYDSGSDFVAGPFVSGDKVKITQAPGVTPKIKSMGGVIVAHLILKGDAEVTAVDAAGNVSDPCRCLVPPPPK